MPAIQSHTVEGIVSIIRLEHRSLLTNNQKKATRISRNPHCWVTLRYISRINLFGPIHFDGKDL